MKSIYSRELEVNEQTAWVHICTREGEIYCQFSIGNYINPHFFVEIKWKKMNINIVNGAIHLFTLETTFNMLQKIFSQSPLLGYCGNPFPDVGMNLIFEYLFCLSSFV